MNDAMKNYHKSLVKILNNEKGLSDSECVKALKELGDLAGNKTLMEYMGDEDREVEMLHRLRYNVPDVNEGVASRSHHYLLSIALPPFSLF